MTSRKKWLKSELGSLLMVLALVTAARSSLADHYYVPTAQWNTRSCPAIASWWTRRLTVCAFR